MQCACLLSVCLYRRRHVDQRVKVVQGHCRLRTTPRRFLCSVGFVTGVTTTHETSFHGCRRSSVCLYRRRSDVQPTARRVTRGTSAVWHASTGQRKHVTPPPAFSLRLTELSWTSHDRTGTTSPSIAHLNCDISLTLLLAGRPCLLCVLGGPLCAWPHDQPGVC